MSKTHIEEAGNARLAISPAVRLPLAMTIAALAMTIGVGGADAKPKLQETGTFDCSCTGGRGTCTFTSGTDNTSCYSGPEDSCTGSCKLTITPDNAISAPARNETGGVKAGTKMRMMKKN